MKSSQKSFVKQNALYALGLITLIVAVSFMSAASDSSFVGDAKRMRQAKANGPVAVSATVVDAEGNPISGGTLEFFSGNTPAHMIRFSETGTGTTLVDPGVYRLVTTVTVNGKTYTQTDFKKSKGGFRVVSPRVVTIRMKEVLCQSNCESSSDDPSVSKTVFVPTAYPDDPNGQRKLSDMNAPTKDIGDDVFIPGVVITHIGGDRAGKFDPNLIYMVNADKCKSTSKIIEFHPRKFITPANYKPISKELGVNQLGAGSCQSVYIDVLYQGKVKHIKSAQWVSAEN